MVARAHEIDCHMNPANDSIYNKLLEACMEAIRKNDYNCQSQVEFDTTQFGYTVNISVSCKGHCVNVHTSDIYVSPKGSHNDGGGNTFFDLKKYFSDFQWSLKDRVEREFIN